MEQKLLGFGYLMLMIGLNILFVLMGIDAFRFEDYAMIALLAILTLATNSIVASIYLHIRKN